MSLKHLRLKFTLSLGFKVVALELRNFNKAVYSESQVTIVLILETRSKDKMN